MKRKIELLAPGGDIDSIKAAILAGADAIYCGLDRFNARNRATNISFENLQGILRLAHNNNCEVFLTLNIILVDSEIPAIIRLLNKLVNTSIDGIIIQDLGLFYVLSNYFKSLKIHASTQLTTHNEGQIKFLKKLNVCRVNLSRELNIHEIKALTVTASENNIFTEVFVHGSYCISFSGLCYMSSVHSGNSGNRGRCSQPCRDQYIKTDAGKDFPLNMKDNSAWFDLKELYEAGVSSLKIEGRIKKFDYVYTIVKSWRKQLHSLYKNNSLSNDNSDLYKVFNRNFSNSFLKGDLIKEMFIDNPRDFSVQHLSEVKTYDSANEFERDKHQFFEEKEKFKKSIKNNIDQLSIEKAPLTINISGEIGAPIKLTVTAPDTSFIIFSERNLVSKGTEPLNRETLLKRLKAINETEYYIQDLDLSKLQPDLYIPFKELSTIKKRILFVLNNSKEIIPPIQLPAIQKHGSAKIKPKLSVLISSQEDLNLLKSFDAEIYFQLPDNFSNYSSELFELFH